MRRKLVLLLVLLAGVMTLALPARRASCCSGDDCGCNYEFQMCLSGCQGFSYNDCVSQCKRDSVRCAKSCCAWGVY